MFGAGGEICLCPALLLIHAKLFFLAFVQLLMQWALNPSVASKLNYSVVQYIPLHSASVKARGEEPWVERPPAIVWAGPGSSIHFPLHLTWFFGALSLGFLLQSRCTAVPRSRVCIN